MSPYPTLVPSLLKDKMISFTSKSTLIQIEEAYSKLTSDDARTVRLPIHLSHGGSFGIIPALIQFVATWSRRVSAGTLSPYGAGSGAMAFSELLRQPHGFVACYISPHLADPKQAVLDRGVVLAQGRGVIEAMQSDRLRETMNGRGAFLACLAGAKNEFLLPLYKLPDPEKGLRGSGEFNLLTRRIIDACAPEFARRTSSSSLDSVSLLLRELFENTNDHARSDEFGRAYDWNRPNVRGILAKFIAFGSYEEASEAFKGDATHSLFFNRAMLGKPKVGGAALPDEKTSETRIFLELSVFDSGPGIARRWFSHKHPGEDFKFLSIQKEEELVREAFELGKTSKSGNGTGVGLDSVCKSMLQLKALLRLRTGRLCLYQDFSSSNTSDFAPSHWLSERRELAPVSGSVFSILIPLYSLVKK